MVCRITKGKKSNVEGARTKNFLKGLKKNREKSESIVPVLD